jgi:AAA domain-containing protein
MTLVVLIGASGSGKTTIADAIAAQHRQDLDVLYFDRIGVPAVEQMIADYGSPAAWQRAKTFDWMFRLAGTSRPGGDILFEGQMRLAFLSAAIEAAGLPDCIPILVDCDDETRRRRLSLDRMQPELADQSMMDWARFLRDEAKNGSCEILDTSTLSLAASVAAVSRHFG